jgi:hypothetical protein
MHVIKNRIESSVFLEMARKEPRFFTRKRNAPFSTICFFLLSTVHESLAVAFRRFTEKTGVGSTITEQSLSAARNKLRWEAFEALFLEVTQFIFTDEHSLWNGFRLWAVDGTKMALPNFPELATLFGSEKGSPTARGSILYDVVNLVIADAALVPLSTDERTLAIRHIDALCEKYNPKNELVLFDRGYPSVDLIDHLIGKGIHFVMRVRRKFNVVIDAMPLGESYAVIGNNRLRVVKFTLDSGEIETLITDLTGDYDFKALYFMRWGVEKAYDVLKNALQIENFSGRTETAIRQDFYIHMLTANNLALAYWEAQEKVEAEKESSTNKYKYKVNVSQATGSVRDWMFASIFQRNLHERKKLYDKMMTEISSAVVPIRPNRIVPRKKNNRNAKFHHNRKDNL